MGIEAKRAELIEAQRCTVEVLGDLQELGFAEDSPEIEKERANYRSICLDLTNLHRSEYGLGPVSSI